MRLLGGYSSVSEISRLSARLDVRRLRDEPSFVASGVVLDRSEERRVGKEC